jgi:hypothetical protein
MGHSGVADSKMEPGPPLRFYTEAVLRSAKHMMSQFLAMATAVSLLNPKQEMRHFPSVAIEGPIHD